MTKKTRLLWIYEGLTQYLGQVLSARSGLIPYDEHLERFAGRIGYLANRTGRNWRALEDTAISGHTLRGGSQNWNDLRRNQDYYDEGALFWLEVDAILRTETDHRKSLDDFCHVFFAVPQNARQRIKPFDLDEIITILDDLAPFDWLGLVNRRIMSPQDALSMEPLERVGHTFGFDDEIPDWIEQRQKDDDYISAEYSIGITITINSKENTIRSVRPKSVADAANLAGGMEIIAINGKRFTSDRFQEALKATTNRGNIEFLVFQTDDVQTVSVPYSGGVRFPVVTPVEGHENLLMKIWAPRSGH